MIKIIIILSFFTLFSGCKYFNSELEKKEPEVYIDYTPEKGEFENGRYLAQVEFYDPLTDKSASYELDVLIENGLLSKIFWTETICPDTSEFSLPDISDGDAAYESAAGFEYKVRLLHKIED